MKNQTVHIKIGDRRTTVTLHPTLFELASLKLGGQLAAHKELEAFLSQELTARLGNLPKSESVRGGLAKYATDVIVSMIADEKLVEQRNTILYD